MGKSRFYFFSILLLLFCGACFFPVYKMVLNGTIVPRDAVWFSSHKINLAVSVEYFFADDSSLKSAAQSPAVGETQWRQYEGKPLHFGYKRGILQLKLTLKNESDLPVSVMLELGWPFLEIIQFQSYSADARVFDSQHTGDQWAGQPVVYRHPVSRLSLAPQETRENYIALQTPVKFIVPIKIWDTDAFSRNVYHQNFWYGGFFAAMVVMLLYNLILVIYTRDKSYLYYCLYVVSVVFYVLTFSGLGGQYFWPENLWFREHSFGLSSSFSFFCVVLFMRSILELDEYGGGVLLLNRVMGWAWFIVLAGHVFLTQSSWLMVEDIVAIVSCPAGLGTTLYLWRKGNVSAKYLTIAWAVLIVATLFLMLGLTGLIPYTANALYVQMVGFVIEVILLSLALAERINRERAEKEAARKDALAYSQRVAESQHREMRIQRKMLDLKKQHNKDLEERVEKRTHELHKVLDELEEANRELEKLSITDPLTQMANRRYYEDILAKELRRAKRASSDLTLLVIDIDHFKQVNDTYGHSAGDKCLQVVAEVIHDQATRATDFVARYGGEEFVVVLPDTDLQQARFVAEKIRLLCEAVTIEWYRHTLRLTVSIGGACLSQGNHCEGSELFTSADIQLYKAKEEGRNKVCLVEFEDWAADL